MSFTTWGNLEILLDECSTTKQEIGSSTPPPTPSSLMADLAQSILESQMDGKLSVEQTLVLSTLVVWLHSLPVEKRLLLMSFLITAMWVASQRGMKTSPFPPGLIEWWNELLSGVAGQASGQMGTLNSSMNSPIME